MYDAAVVFYLYQPYWSTCETLPRKDMFIAHNEQWAPERFRRRVVGILFHDIRWFTAAHLQGWVICPGCHYYFFLRSKHKTRKFELWHPHAHVDHLYTGTVAR